MLRQGPNVCHSFAQGWQIDGYHLESIVKIPAEITLPDQAAYILIAGCYYAHIYPLLVSTSYSSKGTVFQYSQ